VYTQYNSCNNYITYNHQRVLPIIYTSHVRQTMKDKEDDFFGKLILLLTVIGLILFMIKLVNAFIR